ncbi:MAG: ABC transporter permease, partial [Acidimicrobiia bacterium]|nr:ABC transporter permease [Acidimicrobiia bacterium]
MARNVIAVVAPSAASPGLSGSVSFGDVGLALCLVAVAVVVSRISQVGLEGDLLVATFRSLAQLL